MYTRGQFAMIGKTTIKALRIYDKMGLLKPEHIDKNNQYKYYSSAQIDEIILINELKSFGFSLNEIKSIKEINNATHLKECFKKRLAQLDLEVKEMNNAKESLKKKINELDLDVKNSKAIFKYSIEKVELDEMIVASCRERINIKEVGRLIGKVYEAIYNFSLQAVDSHMIILHNNESDDSHGDDWDIEVCIPVNKKVNSQSFSTKIIEGKPYAKTIHVGAFNELGKAHAAVIDWIKENGYEINGSPMEKYLTAKQAVFNPTSFEVEVYYPIQSLK
jgi:DNA-binding transcriptional MerR regulator